MGKSIREDLGEGFKGGVEFVKDAFKLGVTETMVKGKASKPISDHTSRRKTKVVSKVRKTKTVSKVKKTHKKKAKVRKNGRKR